MGFVRLLFVPEEYFNPHSRCGSQIRVGFSTHCTEMDGLVSCALDQLIPTAMTPAELRKKTGRRIYDRTKEFVDDLYFRMVAIEVTMFALKKGIMQLKKPLQFSFRASNILYIIYSIVSHQFLHLPNLLPLVHLDTKEFYSGRLFVCTQDTCFNSSVFCQYHDSGFTSYMVFIEKT